MQIMVYCGAPAGEIYSNLIVAYADDDCFKGWRHSEPPTPRSSSGRQNTEIKLRYIRISLIKGEVHMGWQMTLTY